MSCSGGKMTKKRVITLLVIGLGIIGTIYVVSNATNNFAILIASPLLLAFAACPIMCGVMGVAMWLMGRHSRNKQKAIVEKNIRKDSQLGLDNEYETHYYVNNDTNSAGKELTSELDSDEQKIDSNNSHKLNTQNSTSKSNSKFAN